MKFLTHIKEKKHPYIIIGLMLLIMGGISVFDSAILKSGTTENTIVEQVAQVTYAPLSPLPGIPSVIGSADTIGYLQKFIFLAIGIAIVLAVLMFVIGGVQYMASDAFTSKDDAKDRMTMALFGLLIAFGAYLLLDAINPQLVTFKLPSSLSGNLNIGLPPVQNTENQISRAINSGNRVTRFEIENSLGGRQDGGKLTTFPAGTGKYFEITEYVGLTGDLRNKVITGGTKECERLGGDTRNRFGTFTCSVKK